MRGRHTITVPEFGELVGISRTVAYEAARRGEIPVRRIGHRYVVPVALALRWLGLASEHQIADSPAIRDVATPLREDEVHTTRRGL